MNLYHYFASKLLCLLACLVAVADAIPYPQKSRVAGPIVEAPAGTFSGTASRYRDDVVTYLGIPYAQSPVGDLRFAAPQKLEKLEGVFDASEFGP